MTSVTCHISVSLDGFAAGPGQSLEHPLGKGGDRLHEWDCDAFAGREQHGVERGERDAADVIDEVRRNIGAHVMGRRMFGGGEGPWDESWRGWWGDDPPFQAPAVLGGGERLLEDVVDPVLEPVKAVVSPKAKHVRYRVVRAP